MRKHLLSIILASFCAASLAQGDVIDARHPITVNHTYTLADASTTLSQVDFGRNQVNLISVRAKAPQGARLVITDLVCL